MTQTTFVFTNDYKNEFKRYVDELFARAKRGDLADRAERMALIDELIESYIAATGQRPDNVQLDRLATLCLREELTDRHPDKMSREEFPIMSDEQYVRRKTGLNRKKDGRGIIETSFKLAEEYGADGRNYRRPKRKKREW
jgi:ribosomal protein L17